jgi:hypothetical protein
VNFVAQIRRTAGHIARAIARIANRLRFHLFFKNRPADGEYCNSKRVRATKEPSDGHRHRPYLVVIRCGADHCLRDDGGQRDFDIALSLYARPSAGSLNACEYAYAGGLNKFQAARQFIDDAQLKRYRGFVFLDDDLEMSYSQLNQFVDYCWTHGFGLAQPSLTLDSAYSHRHLLNASPSGWRSVAMVEVMCPYFSEATLEVALNTFDLSYSTWGLDLIWPRLLNVSPVVVDEFTIRHTRHVGRSEGEFYAYLRRIGISPEREAHTLEKMSNQKLRTLSRHTQTVRRRHHQNE